MKAIEQITADGSVVQAPDTKQSVKDIKALLLKHLPVLNDKNPFEVTLDGRRYYLCAKSITHLGIPHPAHKKRIQIPGSWLQTLRKENSFLLGVYSFDGQSIFALFDTSRYRRNKLNNSSAHVHTIDLLNALRYGTFEKTDAKGNRIMTFVEDRLEDVLLSLARNERVLMASELEVVDAFSRIVPSRWNGKKAYDEMIAAGFPDKLQAEWPGFYLEHKFSSFLAENPDTHGKVCRYVKDKTEKGLDFDLAFERFLGDLKTHDVTSGAILGNDMMSVRSALTRDGRLWYVVVSIASAKDKDEGHRLTRYWNKLLREHRGSDKDELSYGGKMKASAVVREVLVAEINDANSQHLSVFSQGTNSNGLPRATKAKILKRDIDNFVIYRRSIAA